MAFVARYKELTDIVVLTDDVEEAVRIAVETHGEPPVRLDEIPPGFAFEVHLADPEGAEEEDNPANASSSGVVLEAIDAAADWFADLDALDALEVETEIAEEDAPKSPALRVVQGGG